MVCTNILLDELKTHTKLQKLNFSIASSVASVCMGTARSNVMRHQKLLCKGKISPEA